MTSRSSPGRQAQHDGGLLADEAVTDAVEPVTPHPVPRVPLLGYRVAKSVRRHRLVERGIEYDDLRQVGHDGLHRLDAGQIRRVVERRQVTKRAHRGYDCVVHPDRSGEPLSAMHHPVTGTEQMSAGMPGLGQVIQHPGHHGLVSPSGKPFLDRRPWKPLDPQQGLGRTEPLADPPHETLASSGEQKRELDRRTARVEHQHQAARTARGGLALRGRPASVSYGPQRSRDLGFPVTDHLGSPHVQFKISGMSWPCSAFSAADCRRGRAGRPIGSWRPASMHPCGGAVPEERGPVSTGFMVFISQSSIVGPREIMECRRGEPPGSRFAVTRRR